ncbi:MAG: hypothetical protein WBQ54_06990, partial [Pseudolabrys sp.]
SGRYPFVKELAVMDAHELAYKDACFDCVVGQFVITAGRRSGTRALGMRARAASGRSDHPG